SMTFVPLCSRERRRRLSALELLDQPPLFVRQARRREELGASPPRQPQGLLAPPARHARVVAGQQHLRHPRAAKLLGARVLRRLQHSRRERLPLGGALAAPHVRPRGSIRITRDRSPRSASTAAAIGSGFSTIPPPPPNW